MAKTERLDKYIASRGLSTRSEVKLMLKKGEVTVNGKVISDPALKVGEGDSVTVNGKCLSSSQYTYIMLNKPQGVVSASNDKRDKTVVDILPDELKRKNLFPKQKHYCYDGAQLYYYQKHFPKLR